MSHVDEGALHAYLDGALDALPASEAARIRQHLASCEGCARRLEEERALREEAAAILAGVDPGVGVVAPLEELRQRAAARGRTGSGSRLRQLTWAASLVLAVGAGWMLRGSRDPRISQALDPLLRDAADERAVPADERAVLAEAVEGETSSPSASTPEAAPPQGSAEALPARQQASGPAGQAAPSPTAQAAPPPSARTAPSALAGAGVARAPGVEERLAGASATGGLPRTGMADVVAVEQVRAKATADVAPAMAVAAEAVGREAPRAMARERPTLIASDQQPAIAVPGLPVLAVETGRADLPAGTLRVLQLLEADTLELLHLPAGADPSAVTGPGGAGRTEVAVRYGAGWLLGRAHRPAEVIEALLARVTGGG